MQVTLVEGKKLNSLNYLSEGFLKLLLRDCVKFLTKPVEKIL